MDRAWPSIRHAHPHWYPSSFYQRKTVFEKWGVDEFIDIRSFDDQDRFGPYVGDLAVARMILSVIEQTSQPVFVFTITMENHGPLHLETIRPEELPLLYDKAPPPGCDDLSIYLRHLRNADAMIGFLRNKLAACPQETSLCWYGDHVPIMPRVYDALGLPSGDVEYVLWHSRPTTGGPFNCRVENALEAHALSPLWFFSSVPG